MGFTRFHGLRLYLLTVFNRLYGTIRFYLTTGLAGFTGWSANYVTKRVSAILFILFTLSEFSSRIRLARLLSFREALGMVKNHAVPAINRFSIFIFLGVLCTCPVSAKRVDDVVVLKNGDRLTGEIKSLQRGELRFKADYMAEAVRLDWTKVARLESKDMYQIYLTNGELFTDRLALTASANAGENFIIGTEKHAIRVEHMQVLKILPVESRFWRQLEGSVDFGFSFTSGNDQYQTNLSATTTYRRGDQTFTGSIDSSFSGQTKGTSNTRRQFTFEYAKQLSPKWYVGGLFDHLHSDQQSLDRRITAGGFVGRNLIQTEATRLSVFSGLVGTRENYSIEVGQPRATNADAVAGVDFTTFRFKTTDIRSRVTSFPSLTVGGRVRLQATSNLTIQVVKDLYWGFHIYENFDSKPPVTANKNDLGISTSLGWKF